MGYTGTTNYGFQKPAKENAFTVNDLNNALDKIDETIKNTDDIINQSINDVTINNITIDDTTRDKFKIKLNKTSGSIESNVYHIKLPYITFNLTNINWYKYQLDGNYVGSSSMGYGYTNEITSVNSNFKVNETYQSELALHGIDFWYIPTYTHTVDTHTTVKRDSATVRLLSKDNDIQYESLFRTNSQEFINLLKSIIYYKELPNCKLQITFYGYSYHKNVNKICNAPNGFGTLVMDVSIENNDIVEVSNINLPSVFPCISKEPDSSEWWMILCPCNLTLIEDSISSINVTNDYYAEYDV